MTTGVQCKISQQCREPASPETGTCQLHQRQLRAAAMRQSPSAATRILGRVLSLTAPEYEAEAGD